MIGGGNTRFDFVDDLAGAAAAVGHDHDAIAFANVGQQIALETPVSSAVAEVPSLPTLREPGNSESLRFE